MLIAPIIAAILGGLIQVAATLVGRVLIALSVGYVTYTGVSILVDSVKADVIANFSSLDSNILTTLGVLQVDTAITMVFSAITARLILSGLTSGSIKRMVVK
jgi:hypothetical protein